MKCGLCQNNPTYKCPCTNIYICDIHLGVHLNSPGTHPFIRLKCFGEKELKRIKSELSARIQAMSKSKQKLNSETKKLLSLVKNSAKSTTKKLDIFMNQYLTLFSQHEIYTIQNEEIDKAFTTCFKINSEKNLDEEYFGKVFEGIIISEGIGSNYWPLNQKVDYVKQCIGHANMVSDEIKFSYDGNYAFNCNI